MSSEAIHIDDLASPQVPWLLRAGNALATPLAGSLLRLDEAALLASARRHTGLDDFGDETFREPLSVLLRALEAEARLTPFGRFGARQLLHGLLVTRLRLLALLRRHPEIEEEPVVSPIIVMGLPRTGTTHLHNLLSSDPSLRSLPYWESLEPIPDPLPERGSAAARRAEDDPRFARCARGLDFLHRVMPLFPLMHEMTPTSRHEEIQLLAVEISTMLFESSYQVPSYRDWYKASDQTHAYRGLRRLLQVLQWQDGRPRRWVLKSPQHLEQIGPLLAVFPDAKIIQTHRDPVRVTASFCTLGTYGLRMGTRHIDPRAVGAYWAARIEDLLLASLRDRDRIPPEQAMDLRFHEFMADEVGSVARIYEFAGQPGGEAALARVRAYQDANPRGRHGTIDYRLEDFGLDAAERRRSLRAYQTRFGVPDE